MLRSTLLAALLSAGTWAVPQTPEVNCQDPDNDCTIGEICSYEWGSEDPNVNWDTWIFSGAHARLATFLLDNGAEDWTQEIYKFAYNLNGPLYQCQSFPKNDVCGFPDGRCEYLEAPKEFYYLQISIAAFYSTMQRVHEKIGELQVNYLSGAIQEIVDVLGAEDEMDDSSFPFAFLSGALTLGAGVAAANPAVAGPLTAAVGVLGMASGLESGPTADELNTELENGLTSALGKVFSSVRDGLQAAVQAYLGTGTSALGDSPFSEIVKLFGEGRWLQQLPTDTEGELNFVTEWWSGVETVLGQQLVMRALKTTDRKLIKWEHLEDEESCLDDNMDARWINEECVSLGEFGCQKNKLPCALEDEQFEYLENEHGIDLEEMYTMILNCDDADAEPDLSAALSPGQLPSCFYSLDTGVRDKNAVGCTVTQWGQVRC